MSRLSIGAAWDEAKAIFERDKRLLLPVALTLMLLPSALMIFLTGAEQGGAATTSLSGAMMLVVLLLALVTIVGNLAIARLALRRGETVGEAIGVAARRVWPLLGAFILVSLPFILLAVVAGMVAGVNPEAPSAVGPGVTLAFLIALVVLIWLGLRLSLATVVAVAEDGGPATILKHSFALTRGEVLRLLGFVLLIVVVALIVSLAVGAVAGALVAFGTNSIAPLSFGALLLGLVQGAIQAGLALTYILMLVAFYHQKAGVEA